MKRIGITLATLTTTAALALGVPAAYAGHGPDDHGNDDRGSHGRHHDDGPGHDRGDDHGHHRGDDRGHGRHGRHGGDRGVARVDGTCSAGARWELKAKARDGGLEVEAEVDSNVAGQAWSWSLGDNGANVASGTATTGGRSGSFSVERKVADLTGTDTLAFVATYGGQTCAGSLAV
jgi:hypothetical protein